MAQQNIPKVTREMLRSQPDQFCVIINKIIDQLNSKK